MQPGRWTVVAVVAVLVAAAPGVASLSGGRHGLDRAVTRIVTTGRHAVSVPPLDGATAITPPTGDLVGEPAPLAPPPAPFRSDGRPGEVFALTVGVDDYPGSQSDLRWAGADAVTVDAALAGFGVPTANRMLLLDGQAWRDGLVGAIESLVARSGPGTTMVLAFAGHVRKLDGDTEAIVTADGGLLTDEELAHLLAPARAERIWILLATCYAGGFTEVMAPGRILTGAAGASSLAYESSEIGGSYLVHHLVREAWLQGRAGPTVQDAFAYADAALRGTPSRRPVQLDAAGGPLRLGPGDPSAHPAPVPAPAGPSSPPPPPDPADPPEAQPTEAPPPPPPGDGGSGTCSLIVLCRP